MSKPKPKAINPAEIIPDLPLDKGVFVSYPNSPFELYQPYPPAGDQPEAINKLVEGVNDGEVFQTLLGVTGSGKTFSAICSLKKIPLLTNTSSKCGCRAPKAFWSGAMW